MPTVALIYQKRLTLTRHLAVLALVAVIAGILSACVGEQGVKISAQEDARNIGTSLKKFSADRSVRSISKKIVTLSATVNGLGVIHQVQEISSNWPETFVTEIVIPGVAPTTPYTSEFPSEFGDSARVLIDTVLLDPIGNPINGTPLLEKYTAVDFAQLIDGGYTDKVPASVDSTTSIEGEKLHKYLWLLRKVPVPGESGVTGRCVALFQLDSFAKADVDGQATGVTLTYQVITEATAPPPASAGPPPTFTPPSQFRSRGP